MLIAIERSHRVPSHWTLTVSNSVSAGAFHARFIVVTRSRAHPLVSPCSPAALPPMYIRCPYRRIMSTSDFNLSQQITTRAPSCVIPRVCHRVHADRPPTLSPRACLDIFLIHPSSCRISLQHLCARPCASHMLRRSLPLPSRVARRVRVRAARPSPPSSSPPLRSSRSRADPSPRWLAVGDAEGRGLLMP